MFARHGRGRARAQSTLGPLRSIGRGAGLGMPGPLRPLPGPRLKQRSGEDGAREAGEAEELRVLTFEATKG